MHLRASLLRTYRAPATDARLTLNVYAQVMQRHRVDEALIWRLMRFPDEPEERHLRAAIETTGPLERLLGGSATREPTRKPVMAELSDDGRGWVRPSDLSRVRRKGGPGRAARVSALQRG